MRQRVVAYARWRISFSLKSSTMQYKHLLPVIILTLAIVACSDDDKLPHNDDKQQASTDNKNQNPATVLEWQRLEFPRIKNDGNSIVLVKSVSTFGINFCVEWDCLKRAQRWTCYQMYNGNSGNSWNRSYWTSTEWGGDPFQPDPELDASVRTELSDYRGSGFTRGHIIASADRMNSKEANEQTYYLSNIQPQYYYFNGGIWLDMENKVRNWNNSSFRQTLYVCKGGTIDNESQIITRTTSGLIVPKYFYMAVLCKDKNDKFKAIAFWVEHTSKDLTGDKLAKYTITIDELEKKTSIDFFCNLSDDIEDKVEKSYTLSDWGL